MSCRTAPVGRDALPALDRLYRRSAWVPPDEGRGMLPSLAERTFDHPRHAPELALGAWLDDAPAGALFARPYREHEDSAVVVVLVVDPCRRRRGVATALVSEARRRAVGLGLGRMTFPLVDERNRGAVGLVVSLGAEPTVRIVRLGKALGPGDPRSATMGGGRSELPGGVPGGWRRVTFEEGGEAGGAARLVSSGALLRTFNAAFPDYHRAAADLEHLIGSPQFLPAASACLTRHDDEVGACLLATARGRRGHINFIATDPRHRRQGLATALLGDALRTLRRAGCEAAEAEVLTTNVASLATFHRLGFSARHHSQHWCLGCSPARE